MKTFKASCMEATWHVETGQLACHWSEFGQYVGYDAAWMHETSDTQGGYLPPNPDFTTHSSFGGANWFQRYTA